MHNLKVLNNKEYAEFTREHLAPGWMKGEEKMKMILDLDTGIDDGMALAYVLGSEDIDLLGVVGTYGNVYTENGVQNVLNILEMCQAPAIPVYEGEKHAIQKSGFLRLEVSARIHGDNGVGQVSMKKAQRRKEDQSGVDFLISSVKKYKKDLVIVATGPMTNLASALIKAPEIAEIMGPVVIMGGALTIPGNVTPYAEANISQDPFAAKYLFESGVDVTMVGLDVTQRSVLTKEYTSSWRETGSTAGRVFADMVDYYIGEHDACIGGCFLHDPSAVAAAKNPQWFQMLPMHMTVVTEGEAAGRTIGSQEKLRDGNPNVKVCIGVNDKALEKDLNENLQNLFIRCGKSREDKNGCSE